MVDLSIEPPGRNPNCSAAVTSCYFSDHASSSGARLWARGYVSRMSEMRTRQAAWIYDRFITSTESNNHPERVLTNDEVLDDIMIYWLTSTAGSSSRLYGESFKDLTTA